MPSGSCTSLVATTAIRRATAGAPWKESIGGSRCTAVGDADGTARTEGQVAALAEARPDFAVYEIEVCQACGWNHLVRSWRTGTPGTAPARRTRRREA